MTGVFVDSIARTLVELTYNDVLSQLNTADWGCGVGTGQLEDAVWLWEGKRLREDT